MQKAVLRVEWGNERERKKAMKTISAYEGIQSVAVDMDKKKVTVIGDMDPVQLVESLRKRFDTDIDYLGPKGPKTEKAKPDANIDSPNNPFPEHVAFQCYGYPPYPPPSYYYPPSAPPSYYYS